MGNETASSNEQAPLLTIGHSTRAIDEFVRLLRAHGVERLVDVRTVPGSRRNPQYGGEALKNSLQAVEIEYIHMKSLGGLRKPKPDSINTGRKNASFRGYADYMQTHEFDAALAHLIELAREKRTAMMCAEAVPWRCHRSLVADALTARGIPVEHILSETRRDPHRLIPFARRTGLRNTYPAQDGQQHLLLNESAHAPLILDEKIFFVGDTIDTLEGATGREVIIAISNPSSQVAEH